MNRSFLTSVLALGGGLSLASADSLTLGGGALLNVRAEFGDLGVLAAASNPGPAAGGAVARIYDNGFVGVDVTDNGGDTTWNWGYQSAGQVQGPNLLFRSDRAAGLTTERVEGDAHPAVELTWRSEFGDALGGRWGFLAGLGFQQVNVESSATLAGSVLRTTDAYSLNGLTTLTIPAAPYSGSAAGPGPLIGSVPTRTTATVANGLTITGRRELDANLIPLALGPSLEWDLGSRFRLSVAAGGLVAFADGDFAFTENSAVAGGAPQTATGIGSDDDWLFGGFVEAGVSWLFHEHASLGLKARWQALESFGVTAGGRYGRLDLDAGALVTGTLSWRF